MALARGGVMNQVWFKALDFSSDKFQMVLGRWPRTALWNLCSRTVLLSLTLPTHAPGSS